MEVLHTWVVVIGKEKKRREGAAVISKDLEQVVGFIFDTWITYY